MLRKVVCVGLCRYHKPGKAEEPGCGGLVRLKLDRVAPEKLLAAPGECGCDSLYGVSWDDPRLLEVCAGCDYFVDGCDFRDPLVPRDACSPCGGLKAVAFLLGRGG